MAAETDHKKDLKAHEGTYHFFTGMMKWATIIAAVAVFIVVLLIT